MNSREIRQFRRTLRRFERLTNLQLKNCCSGVTFAQCLVLLEIEENGRPTTGQLASRLGLDGSTLSRTIDGLMERGLVERLPDRRDRRVVRIALSTRGRAVCHSINRDNDAYCRRVLQRISPPKRGTVIRNFEILVEAFLESELESNRVRRCDSTMPKAPSARRFRSG